MRIVRSYTKFLNELINLNLPLRMEIMGYVSYYDEVFPLLAMKKVSKTAKKTIVVISSHHGEEFYATNVMLKWLRQLKIEEYPDWSWYIFPVINPFGFATHHRLNGDRQDTNNPANFVKDSKVKELAILFEHFPSNAELILDVHGDEGRKFVYMYESKADNLPSIAQKALIENDKLLPYDKHKTIYKCPLVNGVLVPPKRDVGIEGVMEQRGTDYTITLELPEVYNGQQRAVGGVAIINSILKNFKEVSKEPVAVKSETVQPKPGEPV